MINGNKAEETKEEEKPEIQVNADTPLDESMINGNKEEEAEEPTFAVPDFGSVEMAASEKTEKEEAPVPLKEMEEVSNNTEEEKPSVDLTLDDDDDDMDDNFDD